VKRERKGERVSCVEGEAHDWRRTRGAGRDGDGGKRERIEGGAKGEGKGSKGKEGRETHMSPILRLQILMRVPIRVEDNDRIRRLQVESQSSRPRRQNEDGVLGVGVVEEFEKLRTVFVLRRSVETEMLDAAEVEVVFEDGHDGLRLAKGGKEGRKVSVCLRLLHLAHPSLLLPRRPATKRKQRKRERK
jgi:hypothetical protein